MPNNFRKVIIARRVVCLLATVAGHASASVFYSKRGLVDTSTGYMESLVAGEWFRGSGVVARDSRLIYSCGHLFYDQGVWATDYYFYRAYNSRNLPKSAIGASPRGFRFFTNYANNADAYGQNSERAFAYDFTVFYGSDSFGDPAGWWSNGAEVLKSNRLKRIVGYPSVVEYTGEKGYSYQYGTGWFPTRASQLRGSYLYFNKVSTGGGNSGGPVFVKDAATGKSYLGGILVSGSYSTAGVYALNDSSNSMASAALDIKSSPRKFDNTEPTALPDAASAYLSREVTVSGFPENITGLTFSASITTPRRGDLDVYLQSPSGRIRWVHKKSEETSANLEIDRADYSRSFLGLSANGVWKLKMRDAVPGNRATFKNFSVTIGSPVN
jgi:V8-like Glu-specific endopeptidase